jgi:hypothetical protein
MITDKTLFHTVFEFSLRYSGVSSHTPGPVYSTVPSALLKSGIPVDVLIPAPVNAMKNFEAVTISASLLTFSDTS